MNLTNYTENAREALMSAQRIAEERSPSQCEPEHLLLALVRRPESVVPRIFERLNVPPATLAAELEHALGTFLVVSGSTPNQVTISSRLRQVLDRAQDEMRPERRIPFDRAHAPGPGTPQNRRRLAAHLCRTSNLGSQYIVEQGLTPAQIEARVMAAGRQHFRPEVLNRIDEVVIFQPLGREQITQIVDIQLRDLRERLAERDMTLELTPAAKQRLADIGFDPVYGARPLRRAIQQRIVHPLALRLLAGDFHAGNTILVDTDGQQFTFQAAES